MLSTTMTLKVPFQRVETQPKILLANLLEFGRTRRQSEGAIDQTADERNDKPSVAKAVTLEVDTGSAQKLALAASIGTLSLMLRKAGEVVLDPTRRITLSDLIGEIVTPQADFKYATIKVHRPAKHDDYSVPVEKSDSVATTDRRRSIQ